MFRVEDAGVDEIGRVLAGIAFNLGMEKFNPFAVLGFGDLTGIAAVAAEEVGIFGEIEVDGPLIALHVIPGAFLRFEVVACEPEVFALGGLQIVPERFAVDAPEFVAGDFHGHRAFVDQLVLGAVGANGPDAVDFLPSAFVAIHEKGGVGGRKEQVVKPIGVVFKEGRHFPGLEIDGEERHWVSGGESPGHHFAFVGGLDERAGHALGVDAGGTVVGGLWVFDKGSGGEGLVGVDGDNVGAIRDGGEFLYFAGIDVGGVEGVLADFGEEDGLSFLPTTTAWTLPPTARRVLKVARSSTWMPSGAE